MFSSWGRSLALVCIGSKWPRFEIICGESAAEWMMMVYESETAERGLARTWTTAEMGTEEKRNKKEKARLEPMRWTHVCMWRSYFLTLLQAKVTMGSVLKSAQDL